MVIKGSSIPFILGSAQSVIDIAIRKLQSPVESREEIAEFLEQQAGDIREMWENREEDTHAS